MPIDKGMARNDQVTRIFKIVQILNAHPRGLSIKEIHERLADFAEVTDRTVRRDISAIKESGFPIDDESFRDEDRKVQIFKMMNTVKVGKTLILSPGELLALYFAKGALHPLKDTALYADLQSFFLKVDGLLDPKGKQAMDEIASEIQFEPSPRWALHTDPDTLETLRAACSEGHVLSVEYDSAGSGTRRRRRLGPQFLYFAQASLYLVAEDLDSGSVKVFAVPRMKDAQMTSKPYEAPRVNPEKFFESSFGVFRSERPEQIVIRFSAPVAAFVRERRWHSTQQIVNLEGGRIQLRIEAGITPDLVQWVLGFGEYAEVTEPGELRAQLQKAAQAVLDRYSGKLKKAS